MSKRSIRTLGACLATIIILSYIMLGISLLIIPKDNNIKNEEPIISEIPFVTDVYSENITNAYDLDVTMAADIESKFNKVVVLKDTNEKVFEFNSGEFLCEFLNAPAPEADIQILNGAAAEQNADTSLTSAPEPAPEPVPVAPPAPKYYDVPLSKEVQDFLFTKCEEYGVPVTLMLALIEAESDFHADEISKTHDYGLTQVNKCNFADCRARFGNDIDFLDPYDNIMCGVYLFSVEYHAENENTVLGLMRYNCGPTGARRRWNKGIYETAYTRKVMSYYDKYENM